MLEEVTSDTLTEVGPVDGAGGKAVQIEEREEIGNKVH